MRNALLLALISIPAFAANDEGPSDTQFIKGEAKARSGAGTLASGASPSRSR